MTRTPTGRTRTPPEKPEDKTLARRFERRVWLSRLALIGEGVWEALLWPFVVLAAFLIVSLFDLWTLLPPLAHRGVLVAFGIAFLVSLLPLSACACQPGSRRCGGWRRMPISSTARPRPMRTSSAPPPAPKPPCCGRRIASGSPASSPSSSRAGRSRAPTARTPTPSAPRSCSCSSSACWRPGRPGGTASPRPSIRSRARAPRCSASTPG